MFTITNTLTQSDVEQAVKLSKLYYADLIHKVLKPHGPTSGLCSSQVEIEVRAYLEEALTGRQGLRIEVVLAKETATDSVIGFAVVLSSKMSKDCGLNYTAVHKDYRRQGILRAMLDRVKSRYSSIGLSCHPDKVPYYEALGFRVDGAEFVQVTMGWGEDKENAMMNSFDMNNNPEIQRCKQAFVRLNGSKTQAIMKKIAEVQENRMVDVQKYVQSRADGIPHLEAMKHLR
jgi:GNAT superfamily N-acetyltransferase